MEGFLFGYESPQGDGIRPSSRSQEPSFMEGFLFGYESPRGDDIRPSSRSQEPSFMEGFLFGYESPQGGWYLTLFALTRAFLYGGLFVWL